MAEDSSKGRKKPRRARVDFRPNRQRPARRKQWDVPDARDEHPDEAVTHESVRAKGALSRKRTVTETDRTPGGDTGGHQQGIVVAVRGRFVDVEADGRRWPCTIRRVLRTRRIGDRSPVTVGDRVSFTIVADGEGVLNEGVIEQVHPRRTELKRSDGRRTHTIAANVDQVVIVSSVREPLLKPHLIDRYIVAALAGGLTPVICINKIDLDTGDDARTVVERYHGLGYATVLTSAVRGTGLDALRALLTDRLTLIAGQSGVGKSSLLNAVQPGLRLATAEVSATTDKGRHTTTTAVWLELEMGGAVIDTPGIRALDVAMVPLNELEMHFVEFADRLADCRFPDCVHIHEEGCAIREAVERGEIDRSRYESYYELFTERREARR